MVYASGLPGPRSSDTSLIPEAVRAAESADAVVLFLGEEAILSGEAHCRAVPDLPGAQRELLLALRATGKPLVMVLFAGRALCLGTDYDIADAVLYAWHPGVMAGPALIDLMFGRVSPVGRLPISIPWTVGQIPLYYHKRNTCRPASEDAMGEIPVGTPLDPKDFHSAYMDAPPGAQFNFGCGLTYGDFTYGPVKLSVSTMTMDGSLEASVELRNDGDRTATEVVQLYIRDIVASRTRPVRELKDFRRVTLEPGASETVAFTLTTTMLAFHNEEMEFVAEPGFFDLWIAPDSRSGESVQFELKGE